MHTTDHIDLKCQNIFDLENAVMINIKQLKKIHAMHYTYFHTVHVLL